MTNSLNMWKTATFILFGLVILMLFFEVDIKLKGSGTTTNEVATATTIQRTPAAKSSGGCGI